MELRETVALLEKIKSFRPNMYSTLNEYQWDRMQIEWQKVLEPYDCEDVNSALNEFLAYDTKGTYPGVYTLIRNLKTIKQKEKSKNIIVYCAICAKSINLNDYEKHYHRCSSCEYLIKICDKYLNKKLNYFKLFELEDNDFDRLYEKVCSDVFQVMPECAEKENLKSYLNRDYSNIHINN